jgi:hypothetical protein
MAIVNSTLGTSASIVYTSAGNTAISVIYICNTSESAATFNIFLVPFGESAASTNQIYFSVPLEAEDTFILDSEKIFLSDQDKIFMQSSVGSALRCTISFVQI